MSTETPRELVGPSPAIARTRELVRRAARQEGGIVLVGEEGVELEPIARELHAGGRRADGQFVAFDCRVDPASADLELFGETPGDLPRDLEPVSRDSAVARARGGTLYLAHITDAPASTQTRLARLARDREARIDGDPTATDVRLVAGAPVEIDDEVRAKRFRDDLFRRLSAARIDVPSLRDRAEDVPALAVRIAADFARAGGFQPKTFTDAALALLAALTWPGNLIELATVVETAVRSTASPTIHVEHVLPVLRLERAPAAFAPAGNLRDARLRFERDYIAAVLQHHGWRVAAAAETLGIQRPNLYRKARQLGISLTSTAE